MARANEAGLHLTARQLLLNQTIAQLSEVIGAQPEAASPGSTEGPIPPTPSQRRVLAQDVPAPRHWNRSLLRVPIRNVPQYLDGSSVAPEILERVRGRVAPGTRTMVVLDSDHSAEHVLQELRLYSPLVSPGQYLIVEDTNIGHPLHTFQVERGPMEAVEEFLPTAPTFERDGSREKLLFTSNRYAHPRSSTCPSPVPPRQGTRYRQPPTGFS